MKYNNQDLLDIEKQMLGCKVCGGITVREYQLETLKILKEIGRICQKHNIDYFVMFGSLIGAVRHKGFVPWDDDADISMTRENFNRFMEVCKTELSNEYAVEYYKYDMNVGLIFPRIRKKNSTYINRFEISKHSSYAGYYVDIIILDYLSEHPFKEKMQKMSLQALHRIVSPGFSQGVDSLPAFWSGCVKLLQMVIGKKHAIELFENILSSVKKEETHRVMGQLMVPGRLDFCIFDKTHFEKAWIIPFEDTKVPVPQKALTLLNRSYCRKLKREGALLEANYEDEYAAILKGQFYRYDDIMYIPVNRKRNSHIDIIFDSRTESKKYDSYYLSKFVKKKNDKCAVKERKYREKSLKYLSVLNNNEEVAKMACEEIRIREIIDICQNKEELTTEECMQYADAFNELRIIKHTELDEKDLQLIVEILIRASYLVLAKRLLGMAKKQNLFGDEKKLTQQEKRVEEFLDFYYAVFEKDMSRMEDCVSNYTEEDCYLVALIKAVLNYEKKNYLKAEEQFETIIKVDDDTFLAYYYMGKIAQTNRDTEKAVMYYKKSLNCTLYMPLLEMSLKEIRNIL